MSPSFAPRMAAIAAALMLALPTSASAEPPPVSSFTYTPNMTPLGASLRTPNPSSALNSDLAFWGNRAYQGTYDGFRTIDITNPANPQTLLNFSGCPGNQGDVMIWDRLLIRSWNSPAPTPPPIIGTPTRCANAEVPGGWEGLHIFDLTIPGNPVVVGSVDLECGSHTASLVPDLANGRLLVYNSASSGSCPGIDIVEIPLAAPATAKFLHRVAAGRSCHDTAIILGSAMRAACAGGNGFSMFSLGGPAGGTLAEPKLLYSQAIEGVGIGHAASFSWDGSTLVFGHEPGGGTQPECQSADADVKKTMFFFRVADGLERGKWVLPRPQDGAGENCTIHNFNTVPSGRKNVVVSGNYQSGISVVDFTNIERPVEIAYADPAPLVPAQTGGDWSSYWFDGTIYEGDITRGLITWKLTDDAVVGAQNLTRLNPQTQEITIPFVGDLPPEPPEKVVLCRGLEATVIGSAGDDILDGTDDDDVIAGLGGHDLIRAGAGDDVVCGGRGADTLRGQAGRDRLLGQRGRDRLVGGGDKDVCRGGRAKDTLKGCERGKA